MKISKKSIALGMTALLFSSVAAAEPAGVAKVLKNIMDQMEVGVQTMIYGSFAVGLIFVAMSFLLMREAGDHRSSGQNKGIWTGILCLWVAAAGLMYVGISGSMVGESFFGEDAQKAPSINDTDFGL